MQRLFSIVGLWVGEVFFFFICVGVLFFNLFKSTVVNTLLAKTSH